MQEVIKQLQELSNQVAVAMAQLDIAQKGERAANLNAEMAAPGFWDNTEEAKALSKEQAALSKQVDQWQGLKQRIDEAIEIAQLNDPKLASDLSKQLVELSAEYQAHELELTLSGTYDANSAILHLHAGTGGTDAQDWTQMLQRMYLRWAQNQNFKAAVISESAGEEAGLKSAIINIEGEYAYGRLKSEHGVHRLVRKSPFNSDHLRQTSFALVEVLPQIDEPKEVEIDAKDLKIDVYRSSGKGGQSVNTTDSAVRVTHLPTGLVVAIQNERSQLQNRETALKVLRSRLAKLAEQQHVAEIAKLKGANLKAEWGQQIRNYVLDPYKLVKDTRTLAETNQVEEVLDGGIDRFIEAYLRKHIGS